MYLFNVILKFNLIHIFSEPTEADEQVLCTIRYDANGVLSVRPDFNKSRKAYRIETQGMGRGGFPFINLVILINAFSCLKILRNTHLKLPSKLWF